MEHGCAADIQAIRRMFLLSLTAMPMKQWPSLSCASKTDFRLLFFQMSTDLDEIWQISVIGRNCRFSLTPIGTWAAPDQTKTLHFL